MIKLSDYIVKRILEMGVKDIFMITGGGAMHLDDSVGKEKRLNYVCNHHEQACAMAAEGYSRISGNIGVSVVTTGPGGTNTLTGVLGQWHDSVPALYISGQVRYDTTVDSTGLPLRQLGDQEAEIIKIVKPITKYAVMVTNPSTIRYHFEKAVHLATSGRPGPVWLDIPINVQAAQIDEQKLKPFDVSETSDLFDKEKVVAQIDDLVSRIKSAKRPVILAGSGIRTSHSYQEFHKIIDKLNIPVLTAWNAHDVMHEEHPLYFGRPSSIGDRGGNFIIQNSDLLISLGCRLNIRQIGYEFKAFAREAYKVIVDIDAVELQKPTISPDMPVHSDVGFFINALDIKVSKEKLLPNTDWLAWCKERKKKYPVVLPHYHHEKNHVNPYVFVDSLSDALNEEDIIVTANGAASVVTFQALKLKKDQRLIANSGTASMGYDIPAAIGACVANNKQRVICLAGDGSMQMNIQELQTIIHHQLPIKIFVFNNGGYLSIRQTQDNIFGGHYVGESKDSGVSLPNLTKIAEAYGMKSLRIENHKSLVEKIESALASPEPTLCDVMMPYSQVFSPKVAAEKLPNGKIISKPLEDMFPFLDRAEFQENMLISAWEPSN